MLHVLLVVEKVDMANVRNTSGREEVSFMEYSQRNECEGFLNDFLWWTAGVVCFRNLLICTHLIKGIHFWTEVLSPSREAIIQRITGLWILQQARSNVKNLDLREPSLWCSFFLRNKEAIESTWAIAAPAIGNPSLPSSSLGTNQPQNFARIGVNKPNTPGSLRAPITNFFVY